MWFVLLAVAAYLLFRWGSRRHDYWALRGVPGPRPVPFLGTQSTIVLSMTSLTEFFHRVYRAYPRKQFVGLFSGSQPTLLVRDPDVIRLILTKDFEYFPDRERPRSVQSSTSDNLFSVHGVRWKSLRTKMSPTFSSGKIKNMFPLMLECANELWRVLEGPALVGEAIEMKDVLSRYTTDVIGTCAFGINCNALRDPNTDFHKYGLKIFDTSLRNRLRTGLLALFPKLAVVRNLLQDRETVMFFRKVIFKSLILRKEQNVKRNDFLDLLMEIKTKGKLTDDSIDLIEDPFLKVPISTNAEEFKFTDDTLASQAFLFFAAGFETSSTTMSFCLLELSHRLDIQERARQDVDAAVKAHGGFTYEAMAGMTYLEKVLSETLRKYCPATQIKRRVVKPYKLPNSNIMLEPDTLITIPAAALCLDPDYFPDPENFDPERFSPDSKASRHPYVYLPFGEGPRMCIGMRFGQLQSKLGLAMILYHYLVLPSPLTSYPPQYARGTMVPATKDGCHVILQRRATNKQLSM